MFEVQQNQELHAATKLTNKYLNYKDNKMSVKLAVHGFSQWVHDTLIFVNNLDI